MSDDEKDNGMGTFAIFIIFGFICGILTNLFIILPIKHYIWIKLPPDERGSWLKTMTPYGEGISMRGILTCLYYGLFWIFFAIIAANIGERGFYDFVHATGVMIMFSVFMLTYLGTSIWIAHHDITSTIYDNGNKDCKRLLAERIEDERIKKTTHTKWATEEDTKLDSDLAELKTRGTI